MANEPLMTIVGNATSDAVLKFTPNGVACASFTVAVTSRIKQGNEWKDGTTTWFRCTAWREMAECVAETVTKGMRLIVHGRFGVREYEKDGQTRTSVELTVEEIGPSLRYATATVQKMSRQSAGSAPKGGGGDDPWASSAGGPGRGGTPGFDEEPPF